MGLSPRAPTLIIGLLVLFAIAGCCSAQNGGNQVHHRQHHHQMGWRHLLHDQVQNLGLTADVTATIEESLFQKICATVIPLINKYAQGLVIPGQSGSHFSYNNVVIDQFNIGSMAITLNSPNDLQVSLNSISFSIPNTDFDVWDRIIVKISCHGVFWASMSGTSIFIHLTVAESDGRLQFTNAQSSVTWGSLNVGHDFPNFFCKLGNDIIQLFVGNVNSLIEKTVEQDMPAAIGPMVAGALNSAMQRVPLDIVSSPVITSNSLSMTVDLLDGVGHSASKQRAAKPQRRARLGSLSPRDIELEMSETAIDNILIYVQQLGLLNINATDAKLNTSQIQAIFPTVYASCPGCPFTVEVNMQKAPVVALGNESVTASVSQSIMGLNIKAPNGTTLPFVDLYVNATASADGITVRADNTVYFQVKIITVAFGLRDSSIGPIDVSLLTDVANAALTLVVAKFNGEFNGVPLPAVAQQPEIVIAPGALSLAFNMQI